MRKSATQAFYLAFFAIFSGEGCAAKAGSPASSHSNADVCALEPKAKVSDACASYADLDQLNHKLQPYVRNLANNTDFFSYYRLNLFNKKCPFWNDEDGLCGNIACAVTTVENEEDVPLIWRAEELSKLEGPKAQHPGRKQQRERQRPLLDQLGQGVGESCVVEYDDECDDRDYCVPEDESASAKGDYVSLAENPERFTGYAGEGAHQVWEAIYRENCFSRPASSNNNNLPPAAPGLSSGTSPPAFSSQNQAQAALDFRNIMQAHHDRSPVAEQLEDTCLEKRVFYRIISGMHASISTHLCYDHLNQTTGEWGPNLACYLDRLHSFPERVSNLYFNYALVLRAVGKLRRYVQDYTFCTGDPVQDSETKSMIGKLAAAIPEGARIFDERVMFQDGIHGDGVTLKEDFRNRFRNVSRVMDCVGCDKCRLWGKVQTAGFGTALKVLFEFDEEGGVEGAGDGGEKLVLRRTELVALINTLDKIALALKALEEFRGMVAAASSDSADGPVAVSLLAENYSDDLDDDDLATTLPPRRKKPSLVEVFWQEWDLMYRAVKFVLRSWIETPRKLGIIAYVEFMRLTEFWLGWPVRERSWEFRFPGREELYGELNQRQGREL